MADIVPKFEPGAAVTFTASAAITGGQMVEVSGARTVKPGTADTAAVIGQAATDAAQGEQVLVYLAGVLRATAAGAIAAGAEVISATGGKVATIATGDHPIGIALTAAAEDGDVIEIKF